MQYWLDRCGHWGVLTPASIDARWVELSWVTFSDGIRSSSLTPRGWRLSSILWPLGQWQTLPTKQRWGLRLCRSCRPDCDDEVFDLSGMTILSSPAVSSPFPETSEPSHQRGVTKRRCDKAFYVLTVFYFYVFTRATLASASISCRRMYACPSVCHKSVLYWNGKT